MASSEDMQEAIIQVAVQAATAAVKVMREADPPAKAYTRKSIPEESHWLRQAGPMLSQLVFDWEATRYVCGTVEL